MNTKKIAKKFFEGFMIGSGITFWTYFAIGMVTYKLGFNKNCDISDDDK